MLEQMREECIQLQQEWPHLTNFPFLQSRIKVGDVGIGNSELNPRHITFRPRNQMERIRHNNLVTAELNLRQIQHRLTNSADLLLFLEEILLAEERYKIITGVLNAKTKEEAMIRLEKAAPCLLHLENRPSEAIIHRIFLYGLEQREGNAHATEQMILQVEEYFNEVMFGEPGKLCC
jgi:hypothetical protein